MRRSAWAAALLGIVSAAQAGPPRPAVGRFVSRSYAIELRVPAGLSHCPVAADWTGSDHGTILFLTPPTECGATGFPSIARAYAPEAVPRIEVYYARANGHAPPPACHGPDTARFLGRQRAVCHGSRGITVTAELRGRYTADSTTDAVLTLVTTHRRLPHDLTVLRAVAATVHPCSIPWQDAQGRSRVEGSGAACPQAGDFY